MAKKILTNVHEPGRILEVVDEGHEFDVHPDMTWRYCSDDSVTVEHTWEINSEGTLSVSFTPMVEDPEFIADGYKFARAIGYGTIGDQLDMIFKEVEATGTISINGAWATKIRRIKNELPKDDPAEVLRWYERNNGGS